MSRSLIICFALVVGCGPSTGGAGGGGETTPPPDEAPENGGWGAAAAPVAPLPAGAPVDEAPWAVVARNERFADVGLVPLAQLNRGSKVAILVWPALNAENAILDDDVIGSTLQLGADASWSEVHGNWGVRGPDARARIEQELGGADYTVRDRHEGVPFAELAQRFVDATTEFHDAVAAHDRARAVAAAVQVSLLFPVEVVAFGDNLTELLVGVAGGGRFEIVQVDPPNARITLRVRDGERQVEIPFTAIHVTTEADRWILGPPAR